MPRRNAVSRAASPGSETSAGVFAEMFDLLFSDVAARHAYDVLERQDPLAGAVSRRRGVHLWRAWQSARNAFENGRPLEASRMLHATTARYDFDPQAADIAEAERLALVGQCLALGNQVLPAIQYVGAARGVARRFIERLTTDRRRCGDELYEIIEVLASADVTAGAETEAIINGWAATRGLRLIVDLARNYAELLRRAGEDGAEAQAVAELEADVRLLDRSTHITFDARASTTVEFALGDIYTESNPDKAFTHFETVAETLGLEDGGGVQAAVNAANCLLRAGRFGEAEARYASLESLFEMRGDRLGAARVWMSECMANWQRLKDPTVRHSLVGAIKMFEEALPPDMDVMTRYTQKRFLDPGYTLLITANAYSTDRGDARVDETLAAVWAVLSRDALAYLEPNVDEQAWGAMLARQRRPLAATKTALAALPGVAVVHLISGIDCLVWIIYGYDANGRFRFSCTPAGADNAERLASFLRAMHQHLPADAQGDAIAVQELEQELEGLGDAITEDLSKEWLELLGEMKRVIYLPHPFGNVDEFPLGGLRIGGRWLSEALSITRSPSINHLREMLSPNRAWVLPNRAARVVLGESELGDQRLVNTRDASVAAGAALNALGFDVDTAEHAGTAELADWLEGGVGVLHYIGHGIANEVTEALPLANGDSFGPLDADRLDGFRVPFLFFCACVAARVRSGAGGYQTGLASKLIERGAPAAVAFSMPVVEERAYAIAKRFYRAASRLPFGDAIRETSADAALPAYVRLAMTAYGDPEFRLTSMTGTERVPTLQTEIATWESKLRNHCVLRTAESEAELRAAVVSIPAALTGAVSRWIDSAFKQPVASSAKELDAFETAAFTAEGLSDAARLSVRAAVCSERLHASGIETVPIVIATDGASIRRLLEGAHFLAVLGGALFDMRLNGLGNSMMGRVITIDQNDARPAALYLRQGREKLLECETLSPFIRTLREVDGEILGYYGLTG